MWLPDWGHFGFGGRAILPAAGFLPALEIGLLVGQASRPARVLQNPLCGEPSSPLDFGHLIGLVGRRHAPPQGPKIKPRLGELRSPREFLHLPELELEAGL
jgi:hypothetical protein